MARPPSYPNEHAASLRNLKLLVILLAASNILIGAFSVYLLRKVDDRYSELINRSVPVLNDMQTATALAMEAMRGTNPNLFTGTPEERARQSQRGRTALQRDRDLRASLLSRDWLTKDAPERIEFQKAGEEFTRLATSVSEAFDAGKNDVANQLREDALRPAFERYVAALTKVADELQAHSMKTSDALTAKTNTLSAVVMSVASWPVLVLVLLLLVTAVFVIVMMIAFRGKDMVDAP
jgi:hypothetical protein